MTASPKRDRGYTLQSINDLFLRTERLVEGVRKIPEIQKALKATCDYSPADLSALTALLARTRTLFLASEKQEDQGVAKEPTPQQRDALAELGREVGKLRKYARRALAENPPLLELLG
ncbi:hypothetical protein [Armatimonas sp.]|uniref:hypothetical protein n=1 Tax=Armatimonas sp. TaxID=1872638 RepID=UPI003752CACA